MSRPPAAAVRPLVRRIVETALARRGLEGVVLPTGDGSTPEAHLLAEWLEGLVSPGNGSGGLPLHSANKLQLIMDAPLGYCFPLGDVWWSQIVDWTGSATPPRCLADRSDADVRRVESAIRQATEGGQPLGHCLAQLPPGLGAAVRDALRRSGGWGRPPIVPKLSEWTWGVDPWF